MWTLLTPSFTQQKLTQMWSLLIPPFPQGEVPIHEGGKAVVGIDFQEGWLPGVFTPENKNLK